MSLPMIASGKSVAKRNPTPTHAATPLPPGAHGRAVMTTVANTVNSNSNISIGGAYPNSPTLWGAQDVTGPSSKGPGTWGAEADSYVQVLRTAAGVHGHAVGLLAKFVHTRHGTRTPLDALGLAAELLVDDGDEVCEALVTLLTDTWDGGLGQLLSCARAL